jgi:hypothetical protein
VGTVTTATCAQRRDPRAVASRDQAESKGSWKRLDSSFGGDPTTALGATVIGESVVLVVNVSTGIPKILKVIFLVDMIFMVVNCG